MTRYRSTGRFLAEAIEGGVVVALVLPTWPLSRRWLKNWGSLPAERSRRWPADDLVASETEPTTRAIDIDASAAEVWPWLVQFGLGRAGFYSYELFERLLGIPVKNVESIEEEHQMIRVGDEIKLHPAEPGIPVARINETRMLSFGVEPERQDGSEPARSWSMYLEPKGERSCRLILRAIFEPSGAGWKAHLADALEEPIDFIMEQRLLRTISRLARDQSKETARG